MPHLWLQIAVVFYAVGLLHALLALSGGREFLSRLLVTVTGTGSIFHFVALVETSTLSGRPVTESWHQTVSLLAFLLAVAFILVYARYKTLSLGVFALPLIFVLTLIADLAQSPVQIASPLLHRGSVFLHVALILSGYAALLVSLAASLLYLVQERGLKSKSPGVGPSWLPSLQVIDDIGYKSLAFGFPLMTLGLVAGAIIAERNFGSQYFHDPKVLLSTLVWFIYLLLLFMRWSAGWRGRRAALLSTLAACSAAFAWAANYFSSVHRYVAP